MDPKVRFPVRVYLLLALAMVTWGVSWSSGKVVSVYTTPEIIMFWRFLITSLFMIPAVIFFDRNFKVNRRAALYILAGAILLTFYNYLFFRGLFYGLAGRGGVMVTTLNPLITFFIATFIFTHRFNRHEIAGLLLGLLGGLIMLRLNTFSFTDLVDSGNLYFVSAAVVWAFMTILSQKSGKDLSAIKFTFYIHMLSTLMNFILIFREPWRDVVDYGSMFWFNIFYMAVIATSFGTTIYFMASSKLGSKKSSSFIFIVPSSALMAAVLFLNEKPHWTLVSGGVISLGAVYLINYQKKMKIAPV